MKKSLVSILVGLVLVISIGCTTVKSPGYYEDLDLNPYYEELAEEAFEAKGYSHDTHYYKCTMNPFGNGEYFNVLIYKNGKDAWSDFTWVDYE